jgi:hypothetical protein
MNEPRCVRFSRLRSRPLPTTGALSHHSQLNPLQGFAFHFHQSQIDTWGY